MTKQGSNDKELKEAIAIGKKNRELVPRVKNWCSHIDIEDISGGLVAEMYKLPITLRISCPHAKGGYEAMNFEWSARDFILKNCRSCKFHKEIHKANFGKEVIRKYHEYQEKLRTAEKEEALKKRALLEQVETLITKEKSKAEVTELSILNLIQLIEKEEDRKKVAKQILEASKLSPDFFGDIALDYLSLFFDDEEIGMEILQTTQNVLSFSKKLSQFSLDRLTIALEKNLHVDHIAGVILLASGVNEVSKYMAQIELILESLWYKRHVGDPYDSRPSYPNSISLLVTAHEQIPDTLFRLLDDKLKIEDKATRININYLLQELLVDHPDLVMPHCSTIIKSLELPDDSYEESADAITCLTLSELYKFDPEIVKTQANALYSALTEGAKVEFVRFFELVLLKDDLVHKSPEYTESIVERLFQIIFEKTTSKELRESVLSVMVRISKERSSLLSNSFDSLIGYLVDQVKAYNTFQWYLKELKNPNGKISTFNRLQGMDYWEVESERMGIERFIKKTESIVEDLISNDTPSDGPDKIYNIISNLKSSTDGYLKSKLIAVIRRSVKDPFRLAEQLPSIYNFLLDTDSIDVRYEAINFVTHLIEKHDQLVTHTMIDLIKVFLKDVDRGVKGKAIEAFGAVIKKFPNEIEAEQIQIILKSVIDAYVVIHKSAARLAYKVFPFLNENQKFVLIEGIEKLEQSYYQQKEYGYCKKLVEILLFLTKEKPKLYAQFVHHYVVKYCDSDDLYTTLDFIKKLTYIRNENDEFNDVWMKQSLNFLSKTNPDYHHPSFYSRKDIFATMHKIPKHIIIEQIEPIKALFTQKLQQKHLSDVFALYSVLGYFRLYESLQSFSSHFDEVIQKIKSNEFVLEKNEIFGRIASLELRISNQLIDKKFINALNS